MANAPTVVISEQVAPNVVVSDVHTSNIIISSEQGPPGAVYVKSQRYDFAAALEWQVVHNMRTRKFSISLTDTEGNNFFAKREIIDDNSFIIRLTSAIAGHVDVIFDIT